MAQMFGLYYGRIHVNGLTSHDDRQGVMNEMEMEAIVNMVQEYVSFRNK